jgi:hypothetical protein
VRQSGGTVAGIFALKTLHNGNTTLDVSKMPQGKKQIFENQSCF